MSNMEYNESTVQLKDTNMDVSLRQNDLLLCCDTSTKYVEISSNPFSVLPGVSPSKNTVNTQKPSDNLTDLNILRSRKTYSRNSSKVSTTSNEISSSLIETSSHSSGNKKIYNNLQDSGELTDNKSIESSNNFEPKYFTNGISQADSDSIHSESLSRQDIHSEHTLFCDDDINYCFSDYHESTMEWESSVSLPETPKGYQRTRKNLRNQVGKRKPGLDVVETLESKSSEESVISFTNNDKTKSSCIQTRVASKTEKNCSSKQSLDLFNLVFRKGKNVTTYSNTKSVSANNQSSAKLNEHPPSKSNQTNTAEYDPDFSSKLPNGMSLMDLVKKYSEENIKPCANKTSVRTRGTTSVKNGSSVSRSKSSAATSTGNRMENYSLKNVANSSFVCVKSNNKTGKICLTDKSTDAQKSNVFSKSAVQTRHPKCAPGLVKIGGIPSDSEMFENFSKVLPTKKKGRPVSSRNKSIPKKEVSIRKHPTTSKHSASYSKLKENSMIKTKSNAFSLQKRLPAAVHSEESVTRNSSRQNFHFKPFSKAACGIEGKNDINSKRIQICTQTSLNHQLSSTSPTTSSFPLVMSSQHSSSVVDGSNFHKVFGVTMHSFPQFNCSTKLNDNHAIQNENCENLSSLGPSTSHTSGNRLSEMKSFNSSMESTFTNPVLRQSFETLSEMDSSDEDLDNSEEWHETYQTEKEKALILHNCNSDTSETIRKNCFVKCMAIINMCTTVQWTVRDFFKYEDVGCIKDYIELSNLQSGVDSVGYDFPENFQDDLLSSILKDYVHTIITQILPPKTFPTSKVDSQDVLNMACSKLSIKEYFILQMLFLISESLRIKDIITRLNFMALVVIWDEFFKRERGKNLLFLNNK